MDFDDEDRLEEILEDGATPTSARTAGITLGKRAWPGCPFARPVSKS